MIKALIINGARDLADDLYECKENIDPTTQSPTSTDDWRAEYMPFGPDGAQGWGLIDFGRSMASLTTWGGFYTATLNKGSMNRYPVPSLPSSPYELFLKVTMCYNDPKGAQIQDELALKVELKATPTNTTVSFPPEAATSPGVHLPSETRKVETPFTYGNVQQWSQWFDAKLFSSFDIVVDDDSTPLSASTEFAVVWVFINA